MNTHISTPINPDRLAETLAMHPSNALPGPPTSIDWTALEARYAAKPAFVNRLVGVFAASQQAMVEQIRSSARDGDFPALQRLAHSLKGSAGNIMANELMNLALRTEQAARDANPAAQSLGPGLADGLAAALAEIAERLAE